MNPSEFDLRNPPIVEAVLDLDCDLPPSLDLKEIEPMAREVLTDKYPVVRPVFLDEHRIEAVADGAPKVSTSRRGLQALRFDQADGRQLVQVRSLGYSFNRLTPYEGLDQYLPEIERTWQLYVRLVSPVRLRAIRLRYINRIALPLDRGQVQLGAYLNTPPQVPGGGAMHLTGFVTQTEAMDPATHEQVALVLTSQPADGHRLPLILDLAVAVPVELDPSDWKSIADRIRSLRGLKNRIFCHSLTERCLTLFQ